MSVDHKNKLLIERFLKKVPVFRNLPESYLRKFIENFRILHIKKGADIVFQSEESTDLYIVLKGTVKVNLLSCEGDEFILTTFNEGDFFGEMSLIDGNPRSAAVTAEEETLLGVLKRESYIQAVKEKPEIALDLLTALVKRLRKADDMIKSLAFLDVRDRLIQFLVNRAKENEDIDSNGFYRIKKLTHKELSVRIGSSREAISKVLKVLSLKQMVIEENGYFLLSPSLYKNEEMI